MLKGEFIRGDGLVIPNNITTYGATRILQAAMANIDLDFWVGLVVATPDPGLMIQDVDEPTLGFNGYFRQEITRSAIGWPTSSEVNGESYIESWWLTWTAVGGPFNEAINRMMLVTASGILAGDVIALSAALDEPYIIDPATPEELRKFKYRIYLR